MKVVITYLLIVIGFTMGCTKKAVSPITSPKMEEIKASILKTDKDGLTYLSALLKTVHGNIEIKFYSKEAPNSVARIINLIQSGFYDGLRFHRVIPKFVIQTGDPTGAGTGGSGQKLKSEINSIPHIKGTVALARGESSDSADSQIYMALTTLPHLDGKYTVIGQVVKGLDVLDKITKNDKILSMSIRKK